MGREDETKLIAYRIWDKKAAMTDSIVSELLPNNWSRLSKSF